MTKKAQEAIEEGVNPETETTVEVVEETMSHEDFMNERIPFKAIYDGEKYKDDIVVTINGKNWQIQRGKEVMIPRFVYFAICDSDDQRIVALSTSKVFEDQYKNNLAANMM